MFRLRVILMLFFVFVVSSTAWAILPTQFFVQGLSSFGAMFSGIIVIVLAYFFLFWRLFKNFFRKYKKSVLFVFLYDIVIAVIIGAVFYWGFYKPLYKKSHIFSATTFEELQIR